MHAPTHRLFFAVRPPPQVAHAVEAVAAKARAAGLAHGHWLRAPKYHLTVRFLGSFAGWPGALIERALAGAAALRLAPFEIVLDRISSFAGRRQAPCILRCDAGSEIAMRAFSEELGAALAAAGIQGIDEHPFVPHLTLAYAERAVPEDIPVEALRWQVHEFMLIASHVGTSVHEALASWRLQR